jgi:hypothetical protein
MSSNNNISIKTTSNKQTASNRNIQSDKNIIKHIPANLRQQLKDVNISPVDEGTIAKKLAERLSANVISAQAERLKYVNTLSQRVSVNRRLIVASKKNLKKYTNYLMFEDKFD